jgi:hypothetical protein
MSEDFKNNSIDEQPVAAGAQTPPALNINDLKNLLMIIDLATKRGSFQPKEFSLIGDVYNRVDAFISATSSVEKSGQEG